MHQPKLTLKKRKSEYKRLCDKYPDRVPVIVFTKNGITLKRNKFLVPYDLLFSQFQFIIRRQLKLSSDQALFMFLKSGILVPAIKTVSQIHQTHQDEDGFLYVTITLEDTFGYATPVFLFRGLPSVSSW